MIDLTSLGVFLIATVSLNLTPGPDMLYVFARSLGQGKRAGIASALGIGVGSLVHTIAAALGLSALLLSSEFAFDIVKYLGALYLCYLGIKMFTKGKIGEGVKTLPEASLGPVFRQGVVTNIFNPKVALFFLAFLPQFVDHSKGDIVLQLAFLGCLFVLSGTTVNIVVAILTSKLGHNLKEKTGFWKVQRWFTGGVFLTLGVRLALSK